MTSARFKTGSLSASVCLCVCAQQAGGEGEEGVGSSIRDGEERGQRRGDRGGAGEGEALLPTEHVRGQR